ncbi:hypothetical protein predicted by Glimmer/Critica [Sorangium cellulosum So ce56]|uniref:Uncharacterized protein n=1 Tax=Sorangium cellulosum (strain So ce56) TaxID=448385 RepID=A9GYF7_SORC5|nr:hypothetical protein [Sorangium cellulosum]CAN97233.1 hypothetical protein predicted by Glimmer/Critica [Sorangium cellulosum So ce56]
MRRRRGGAAAGPARALPRAGWGARWLVVLALLAQLCGLSHALLVPHARCEHGDLVHVAAAAALHEAERRTPGAEVAERRTPGAEVAERAAGGHLDDDHCDLFTLRGQLGAPVHPVAEATLLEVLCPASLRSSSEVRPIPLLILAPKSSPPAA